MLQGDFARVARGFTRWRCTGASVEYEIKLHRRQRDPKQHIYTEFYLQEISILVNGKAEFGSDENTLSPLMKRLMDNLTCTRCCPETILELQETHMIDKVRLTDDLKKPHLWALMNNY